MCYTRPEGIGDTENGRMFRERFTVTGGDRTVSEVGIRVQKAAGTTELLWARLLHGFEVITFAVSAAGAVPVGSTSPRDLGTDSRWVVEALDESVTLEDGETYALEFSSSGRYLSWGIRKGTAFGYHPSTCFPDGEGEYSTDGTTWHSMLANGGQEHQTDVQCFLR